MLQIPLRKAQPSLAGLLERAISLTPSDSHSPRRLSLVYDFISREIPLTESKNRHPWRTLKKCRAGASQRYSHPFPGGHSGVVPPDPIPNSEVKRACADGSVALPCKSRSPPGALSQKASPPGEAFVFGAIRVVAAIYDRRLPPVTIRGFSQKPPPETVGVFLWGASACHGGDVAACW